MAERPILFSAPMVRAIIDGSKTQTRRVLSPRNTLFNAAAWDKRDCPFEACDWANAWIDEGPSPAGNPGPYLKVRWPYGRLRGVDDETLTARVYPAIQPGDRLWARETCSRRKASFLGIEATNGAEEAFYSADGEDVVERSGFNICPWWRGQSLPSIHMPRWASRITLIVESVRIERLGDINRGDAMLEGCPFPNEAHGPNPLVWFEGLWDSINASRPGCAWADNPWVIVVKYRTILANIDRLEGKDNDHHP